MHVLTLVAAPATALTEFRLVALAAALGADRADWLAREQAADLFLAAAPTPAMVSAALQGDPIDAIVQPRAGRAKRFLIADMDSTMVTSETLDELAAHAGLKRQVAAITERSMNGEIDFRAALIARVALLRGLPIAALDHTWRATALMPGAQALLETMRAHGAMCVLASGGFTYFASRLAERLGFQTYRANTLEHDGAVLTGRLIEPILDRQGKRTALRDIAAGHGIGMDQTMAVGDGANDLDMLREAGIGVAFHAKPIVAREAQARIDHTDLHALLFMQGYRPAANGGPWT